MHTLERTTTAALLLASLALPAHAQSDRAAATRPPVLLVLSKAERTLALVDPATRAIVARVPSGPDPHEVVASADGTRAFISNYGGGNAHTITIVDLVARQPTTFELGALTGPHGLVFANGELWFTAEGAKVVGRYDPGAAVVDLVLGTGQNRTHMLHVSRGGDRIVTTNVNSGTVSIIEQIVRPSDPPPSPPPGAPPGAPPPGMGAPGGPGNTPRVDWDQTVVRVGNGAEGFDLSPDEREAWVANAQDGTISVIDLASKRVVQTITADVAGANRLKFTPDGALVFVSTLRGPNVTVLRAATREVVKRVPVGRGAAGILMQPDGALAYVAATPDDYVAVIDVKSLAVVGRIAAGRQPDGLAWVDARPPVPTSAAAAFARRVAGCYRLDDGPWRAESVQAGGVSTAATPLFFELTDRLLTAWDRMQTSDMPMYEVRGAPGWSYWRAGRQPSETIRVGSSPLPLVGVALTLMPRGADLIGTVTAFTDAIEKDKPSEVTRAVRARRIACAPTEGP
jgi:YVTN family beta-propeller protein